MKKIIAFLLTAAVAFGAATDVVIPQRNSSNRNEYITITGSANPWEAIGFNASGILGPITLLQMMPSGSGGQYLRRNAGNTALEFATITPLSDADYGDITVSGTGTVMEIDSGAVTTTEVLDGTLANADISASAAIALSKLATDPLARANHTGTQTLSTISDAGTLAGLNAVASAQITDGTIVNADINASAAIATTKLDKRVGTDYAAQITAPITTNPYAPTWTSETLVLPYGATGEIDLPAVATYTRAVLMIYCTGTFTITVDPNGSEVIYEQGASLGAGVADVISGTAGMTVAYFCDAGRWVKLEGGSGTGSGFPLTEDADFGNYDANNVGDINSVGTITGVDFVGNGSGLTNLSPSNLVGTFPNGTYERITTTKSIVHSPTEAVSNVIVTTDAWTTVEADAATETLTYSTTPATGSVFMWTAKAYTADTTFTIPTTYSVGLGATTTEVQVAANKFKIITVLRTNDAYVMWDPIELSELDADTSPETTDLIEVGTASGSKKSTIAQIKATMRVGTKLMGSIASGFTTTPTTLDWENNDTIVCNVGGTATHNLPAASTLGGVAAIVYVFNGSYTITLNPDDADYIRFGSTTQADGVSITITGTAGETAFIYTDGTNWSTTGGTADFAAGS